MDSRFAVGLMSGTSVDGIDAVLIEISGERDYPAVKEIAFDTYTFKPSVKRKIFELFNPETSRVDNIGYMNFLLGELFADAANSIIQKSGIPKKKISVIGSHGQTIYHQPKIIEDDGYNIRYTFQIGEGAVIAERTSITTVSDFRTADIAVGGQGAPLVPFTEYLLYRKKDKNILLQNIGGIGNITVIPKDCSLEEVYAFDTGPGNMIIDKLCSIATNGKQKFDKDGIIASSGSVNESILEYMRSDGYVQSLPPKSTGRELYGDEYTKALYNFAQEHQISITDLITTATFFTAWSIAYSYRNFIFPRCKADCLAAGGGGSHNLTLMRYLKEMLNDLEILRQEDLGFSSDSKEAIAFALLADYALERCPNNLPSATGATKKAILGKISWAF